MAKRGMETTGPGIYARLPAFVDDEGVEDRNYVVNVVIETPRGCRNKYTYSEGMGVFELTKVLPAGSVFPYDFGFVPGTQGGDGDPLDILVLMDEPTFTGCLLKARLIGVIEAEQTERDGATMRNDRLIGVAALSHSHNELQSIHQLTDDTIEQIEHFFLSYNEFAGKKFKPLGHFAADRARKLVEEAAT